jgi:hypothetical protein
VARRPYEAYSEAELLDLRRRIQASGESIDRDLREYDRRNPTAWNSEGRREIDQQRKGVSAQVSAIDDELAERRASRG